MVGKRSIAFMFSLAGAILIFISGIFLGVLTILFGLIMLPPELIPLVGLVFGFFGETLMALGIWSITVSSIIGILMLIGAFMVLSTIRNTVIKGSILVIALSIIAIFLLGGCFPLMGTTFLEIVFYAGVMLAIIGGTLGIVWRPSKSLPPPPPP